MKFAHVRFFLYLCAIIRAKVTKTNNNAYLPGLNAIRVLAMFSILFGHMYAPFGDWGVADGDRLWLPELYTPVVTFFVISGFLIAYLLMIELDKTGEVDVLAAYKRRAIRILPLYYVGILFGLAALWLCGNRLDGNVPLLLLAIPNVSHALGNTPLPFCHYWTVGVEVMFYLFFPWIVKWSKDKVFPVTIACCLGWMVLKYGGRLIFGKGLLYDFCNITMMDCILFGSIGAILYYRKTEWLCSICSKWWFAVLAWGVFLFSYVYARMIPAPIRHEYIAIISLMVILSGFCGHAFGENKVMAYLGKISYAFYMFHPFILYVGSTFMKRYELIYEWGKGGYLSIFAVVLVCVLLAMVVNKFIEEPITKRLKIIMYEESKRNNTTL